MEKRIISNIIRAKRVDKVGKYVVELAFRDRPKETVWMTQKQLWHLKRCFGETPNGYSTNKVYVVGIWDGHRYVKSEVAHDERFIPPMEQDVTDLWEVD
ncbi:hypothetical protein [Geobacillus kaustophilus]|uniref:hypothetical protein n=1 Tax=Geobacillus kaustophilus TaxID=1462 RepID=UPI0005CCB9A3|nr:hypothetical protein [Geobacillus kaustophilus]